MAEQCIGWREHGGAGGPVVMLPGWAQPGRVLEPLARRLAASHRVAVADLPGTGRSGPDRCGANLGAIADAVVADLDAPATLIGWSLGGLVALACASRHPDRVERVVLMAATPRFAAASDWPGIDPAELERFAAAVDADPDAARDRFLAFQLGPTAARREALRWLRRAARAEPEPELGALRAGLELLRTCDLRHSVTTLACPIDAILAERDPLIPSGVAPHLRGLGIATRVLADLGHAPFVTAPDVIAATLSEIELERRRGP